jgi:tetratricopeptide (TPR) repeat protein
MKAMTERTMALHQDSGLVYADSASKIIERYDLGASERMTVAEFKARLYSDLQQTDSAYHYLDVYHELALENGDSLAIGRCWLYRANFESQKENLYVAEKFIVDAENILIRYGVRADLAQAYSIHGAILSGRGEYERSQTFFFKAFDLYQKVNDLHGLSSLSVNIGNNYKEIGSDQETLKYYHYALEFAEDSDYEIGMVTAWMNLGVYYRSIDTDSAKYYYQKALDAIPSTPLSLKRVQVEYNYANIFLDNKEYDKAMAMFEKLYKQCRELNIQMGMAVVSSGLAAIYTERGRYDIAEHYILDAIAIFEKDGVVKFTLALKKQLKELYQYKGDYKKALEVADALSVESDSLNNLNKQLAIHDMELFYQSEYVRLENEKLQSEVENNRLNLLLRLIIIFFLIIFMVSILVVYQRNAKNRIKMIANLEEINKIESELRNAQEKQSDWLKKVVKQQQNEWMQLSEENEEIRRKASAVGIIDWKEDKDVSNISKKEINQFYLKNMMTRFNVIYPDFVEQLQQKYPEFRQQEIQFCMLVKINIPLKDIASILNVSMSTIEKRRQKVALSIGTDGTIQDLYESIQEMN